MHTRLAHRWCPHTNRRHVPSTRTNIPLDLQRPNTKKISLRLPALYTQLVRIGLRSVFVVSLVNFSIGAILAIQMAPPLQDFGQTDQVATIIAIAVVRELGPLISAVVLTGFAGASVAAELGTMVVGEEIEALQAHGLNPVRFLVVPRMLATVISLILLTIIGMIISLLSGMLVGVTILDIPYGTYKANTLEMLSLSLITSQAYGKAMHISVR